MSTFEASYKSLLQGVSQQLPQERLEGQVSSQVNMMSDPVTNLRRRQGIQFQTNWEWAGAETSKIVAWFTDIAGARVHVLVNTATGAVRVLQEDYSLLAELVGGDYLITNNSNAIRATSVGDKFFIANCDRRPILEYGTDVPDPNNSGFFYINSGAFSKGYNVKVIFGDGEYSASYTTPSGTGAGDAAASTPEYIANQLYLQLNSFNFEAIEVRSFQFAYYNSQSIEALTPPRLQFNTGTALAPTWVNVTFPLVLTPLQINTGFLRVLCSGLGSGGRHAAAPRFRMTFKTQAGGVWSTEIYTSAYQGAVRPSNANTTSATAVRVTAFTSQVDETANGTFNVEIEGPYVFITKSGGISVSTTVGTGFMIASKANVVSNVGQLPARLPAAADGFICRVGTNDNPQYYRYEHLTTSWLETGQWNSPTAITNMPVSITRDLDTEDWVIDNDNFEGRLAGDDVSNQAHAFMTKGITGMGTYQGRLVLLSGSLVSLSASNKPMRFFRSTVTSLLGADCIEIGSALNSAAAYEYAVPFQKDLLLFSKKYQAVIPSGNTAITPSNATVVPTSSHEVDTTSSPITIGRTLLYASPKSAAFFGVLEMLPSNYTDSQYVSQESTPHLPKYMGGRCRFAVSSNVTNLALFAPTGDSQSLIVHEYHWDGDNKVQQAWHTWTAPYPIATAYFAADRIIVVMVNNEQTILVSIDPKAGAIDLDGTRRPFLDLNTPATIVARNVPIPEWMLAFDPEIGSRLKAIVATGALAGELVGTSLSEDGLSLNTVASHPEGEVVLGIPYYSGVIPTPPIIKDYNNETIHSGKATLLRFNIGTKNSSEFNVKVDDAVSSGEELGAPTLSWSSTELELGRGLFADTAISLVPCRTDLRSTNLEVSTEGTGELNITSLEYVAKYHPKIKRR